MTMITEYYQNSELALAAYADLNSSMSFEVYVDALEQGGKGMSESQAKEFAENWTVLDQYDGTIEESYFDEFGQEHYYINHTGLSVTLFQNSKTGEQVVAVRGTDDISDVVTDIIDIGALGTAEHQVQYKALSQKVHAWKEGRLLKSGFTVTGHSLGGFLATNLALEYYSDVVHTYIYNAPGLDGINGDVFTALYNAFLPGTPLSIPHHFIISNIVARNDVVSLVGRSVSTPITVEVEPNHYLKAHSIVCLTDALAVSSMLAALDPGLTIDDVTPIIKAASGSEKDSLENIVDAVGDLFQAGSEIEVDNRNQLYTRIQEIQNNLIFQQSSDLVEVVQTDTLASHAEQNTDLGLAYRYALVHLNSFAITGDAAVYAQHNAHGELDLYDPITDEGDLTEEYIKARAAMLEWNVPYNSDIFEYNKKQSTVEDNWDYLDITSDTKLAIDGSDLSMYDHQIVFGSKEDELLDGSGDSDKLFGMDGKDTLQGKGGDDYLEGNSGSDTLNGGDGNDKLYGGMGDDGGEGIGGLFGNAGDDALYGGAGKDLLNGGAGRDLLIGGMGQDHLIGGDGIDILYGDHRFFDESTQQYLIEYDNASDLLDGGVGDDQYYANAGDRINDADGKGWINMMVALGDGRYSYESLDVYHVRHKTEFDKIGGKLGVVLNYSYNENNKELTVSQEGHPDNWIVIENFTMGQFGIGVDALNTEQFIDECYWLYFNSDGETKPEEDYYASYDPWWYQTAGTEASEVITGGDGDDEIIAAAGDDEVYAGPGDDTVYGGLGDDKLYGQDGYDLLYGGPGNDQMRGGTGDGDVLDGGFGNDIYIFGLGDGDTTINNADNSIGRRDILQFLSGITPEDVTISRNEYDLILNIQTSGESITVTGYFWQEGAGGYALDAIQFTDGTSWDIATILEMPLNGSDEDDTIYGDSGDDIINGHGGNDTLVGLEGNDTISGGDGDDQLFGFAGNDKIHGDTGNDYLGGAEGADILYGGIGDDTIFGGEGRDVIYGNAGNDYIDGGESADGLYGGTGDDTIYGGDGDDYIRGMEGADTIHGGSGHNFIYGGGGDDHINGGTGDDEVHGGDGNDYIVGGSNYSLNPNSNDLLFGESGDDVLANGNGYSSGGDGNDTYIHNAGDGNLVISNDDTGINSNDVLIINGIESSIPQVERGENDELIITYSIDSRDETITVYGYFSQEASTSQALDSITFSEDGIAWDIAYVKQAVLDEPLILYGGPRGSWLEGAGGDDFIYGDEDDKNKLFGMGGNDYIEGGDVYDYIDGGDGNDRLIGRDGGDYLFGKNGNDYLAGGGGTDTLNGGSGDDVLYGGAGEDDLLIGHNGADTYLYGLGDGNTKIIPDEHDTLRFLPSITPDDIEVSFVGDDLHLIVKSDGAVIVFQAYFDSKIEADMANLSHVEFADGTVWDAQRIADILGQENDGNNRLFADESGSTLNGMGGDDWLIGKDGNDTLYGSTGYDLLWGGGGDDTLASSGGKSTGGGGSDTYIHVAGSGDLGIHNNDFGSPGRDMLILRGISHSDTQLSRGLNNELELRYEINSRLEQITILNFFDQDEATDEAIDSITFSDDGTTWDLEYIKTELLSVTLNTDPSGEELHGAGGNDILYGAEGEDQLYGENGHDTIDGAAGNDHIYGGYGDDNLSGGEGDDELMGGAGADSISGGDGADYMDGAAGDDSLLGDDGNDILIGGDGNDYLFGGEGDDDITGDAGDDTLEGGCGNDVLDGGDGDDYIKGGSGVDKLIGGKGDDMLWSIGANNELYGGEGDDAITIDGNGGLLDGGAGDDILRGDGAVFVGGKGNDILEGGHSDDRYLFSCGDGQDTITDHVRRSSRGGTIEFTDVASTDITAKRSGNGLILFNILSGDQITVEDQFHGRNTDSYIHRTISNVVFSDGVTWRYPDLISHLFEGAIEDQVAILDENFSFYIINSALRGPNNRSFKDVPALLEPTLEDGSPLPDWLSFDRYDGHFSGTPGADDVGELRIKVTTFCPSYGIASDIFVLDVSPPIEDINHAPVLETPIADRTATEGELLSFRIPGDTFSDKDYGDTLLFSATLEDGSPLPSWLNFDQEYHAFSGTPYAGDVGELKIKVVATDHAGASVSDIFALDVSGIGGDNNHAPVLDNPLADQRAMEGDSFSFQVPSDIFSDVDVGDELLLTATLGNGSPLPDWLIFDSIDCKFSGTPSNDDVGDITLKVVATDQEGATAETCFDLSVINVNDAPELVGELEDLEVVEGDNFSHIFPDDTFRDVDVGDKLVYSALMSNGSLPSWLSFDPVTMTLAGELPLGAAGDYDITIQATDLAGASVSDSFYLAVVDFVPSDTPGYMFDGNISGDNSEWVYGTQGKDQLFAVGKHSKISGGQGNDVLYGCVRNDYLTVGKGSDTYLFPILDGKDAIDNFDVATSSFDSLNMSDVAHGDLSFTRQRNDLVVDVVGSEDKVTITNWHWGESIQLETIDAGELQLRNDQVSQLVNAMAQFDVPDGVGAVITQDGRDQLEPVLAACW